MKCECGNEIGIALASQLRAKGCKVLAKPITVVSVQCEKCGKIVQVPLSGKPTFSVKKEE